MFKKEDILKNILRYSTGQYIAQVINFFTSILMRRFLGPFNVGVWNMMQVVKNYVSYVHLGTTHTVFYKFPILRGKGELKEAEKIKNVVFSYIMLATVISSVAIIIYTIIFGRHFRQEIFYGLFAVSILLLCERVYTYYVVLLRANKDFKLLSKSVVFNAIIDLSLVLLIVSRFKLYGLYVVVILMPVLNTLYIRKYATFNIGYSFDLRGLAEYIKYGFPLFLNGIVLSLLNSIDKIMIAAMLGLKEVGFYSIALMTRSYGWDLFRNFEHVITPSFLEDYGRFGEEKSTPFYITKTSFALSYIMTIFLAMIFIWAPLFVRFFMPAFVPGIDAMKIFLIATFFSTISPSASNYLVVINKRTHLLAILSLALISNICLNYTFIKLGFGINGVALATVIASFISFLVTLAYAMKHFEKLENIVKLVLSMLLPLFYSTAVLLYMDKLLFLPSDILANIIKSVFFIILFSPFLFYLHKRTPIFKILFGLLLRKPK